MEDEEDEQQVAEEKEEIEKTETTSNFFLLPALEFEIGTGHVIRGLEVAIQRMSKGEMIEATIPHLFGYGGGNVNGNDSSHNNGYGQHQQLPQRIPPRTDLLMVVKLIEVRPSQTNIKNYHNNNDNDNGNGGNDNNNNYGVHNILTLFCHGFCEGLFIVLVVVVIPVLLLFRYYDISLVDNNYNTLVRDILSELVF